MENKRNDFKLLSKEEDLPVTKNKEQKFWELGLLGCKSAISLLHTVYIIISESYLGFAAVNIYCNITVANVDVGSDFFRFKET